MAKWTVAIWLSCATFNFGVYNARLKGFTRDLHETFGTPYLKYEKRGNTAFTLGYSLLSGPFGVILSPFLTELYVYGIDYTIELD